MPDLSLMPCVLWDVLHHPLPLHARDRCQPPVPTTPNTHRHGQTPQGRGPWMYPKDEAPLRVVCYKNQLKMDQEPSHKTRKGETASQ